MATRKYHIEVLNPHAAKFEYSDLNDYRVAMRQLGFKELPELSDTYPIYMEKNGVEIETWFTSQTSRHVEDVFVGWDDLV